MARDDIERLVAALDVVAKLVLFDSTYVPIFERLERELELARGDAVARARAVVQNAKPSTIRASCSSDAPLP